MKDLFPKGGLEMKSAYLKGCIGFAVLLSVTLAVGCATTGAPLFASKADHPGPMPAGSTWVQERRDSGSFGSGTVRQTLKSLGEQTWQGRKVYAYENPQNTLLLDAASMKWVAWVKGSTPLFSYDPPMGYSYPLWVDKTWQEVIRITFHGLGQSFDVLTKWKVEAQEEIKVPAGTFKVFRVTRSDIGQDDTDWWHWYEGHGKGKKELKIKKYLG